MPAALTIPRPVLEAVIAHARAVYPKECCGLLAGSAGKVVRCHPLVNELQSPTAYRSEPRSMLAAMKAMRAEGTDLVAVYHSHPSSDPVPSRRDVAENLYSETIHLIVGLAGTEPVVRAWLLQEQVIKVDLYIE